MKKLSVLKKPLLFGLVALLAGAFLVTTGFDRYQDHPLKSVATRLLPAFSLSDARMTVAAKAMTAEESKRAFGHDLISRGIRPVQLTIQNNTSHQYSMCAGSVDLPRVESRKVAHKVKQSTLGRSIGYRIAGFLFWPFMIPGTIDSIRVIVHHQELKKDLMAKAMKEETVAPYSTWNRVLFVPGKDFKTSFKVTLIDLETLKPMEFQTTVTGDVPVS